MGMFAWVRDQLAKQRQAAHDKAVEGFLRDAQEQSYLRTQAELASAKPLDLGKVEPPQLMASAINDLQRRC